MSSYVYMSVPIGGWSIEKWDKDGNPIELTKEQRLELATEMNRHLERSIREVFGGDPDGR